MVFVTLFLFFGGLLMLMAAINGSTIAQTARTYVKGK